MSSPPSFLLLLSVSRSFCWLNLPGFSPSLPFLPAVYLSSPLFPLQVRRTIAAVWAASVSRIWCVRRNVAVKAPWSTAPISNWPVYLRTSPSTPQTCKSARPVHTHTLLLYATRDETSYGSPCVRLLEPETVNHHTSFNTPQSCREVFHFLGHRNTPTHEHVGMHTYKYIHRCTYAMHAHTSAFLPPSLRLTQSSVVNVTFHF